MICLVFFNFVSKDIVEEDVVMLVLGRIWIFCWRFMYRVKIRVVINWLFDWIFVNEWDNVGIWKWVEKCGDVDVFVVL